MLRQIRWAKIAPRWLHNAIVLTGVGLAGVSLTGLEMLGGDLPGQTALAATKLVSSETIGLQKKLTHSTKLSNGIPVVIRDIPGSDIVQFQVNFGTGLRDLPPGRKALAQWYWDVAPLAGKGFPKQKVFALTAQYGIQLECGSGIEHAQCSLGTINDYWKDALPLLASIVKTPTLGDSDAKVVLDRVRADLRSVPGDPNGYVNEVVNSIFYPKGHPYRLNHDEALKELASLTPKDLKTFHKQVLNADQMSLVVVSSLPRDKILKDLEKYFGDIKGNKAPNAQVPVPTFSEASSYTLVDRTVPTAFVKIKMNAPSIADKDAVASLLMFDILSEELGDEIRTKRSLSYAVHAFTIQYSLGIGVISVSTSKPKETFEALHEVIKNLKDKTFTDDELEEHKNVFATEHYLTQETHASMAAALSHALFYYGDATKYYDMAQKLADVTPADIQRLARSQLINPRVGVIFDRKQFDDTWAKDFISKNLSSTALDDKKT
jgi:zinc protease